ncbi:hypothetical protein LWI29_031914 [Acer saccharum]|uniref:Uncharacterized protein n=1 Tax=Acer saccharum TaxID=4024 RepID=A0AA39RT19_ACESA|nr:hypothetical protein LWI29_031914 [Acer saccharum]
MVRLGEILKHPDELHVLLKLKVAVKHAEKQITLTNSHWGFCYSLLNNFSNGVAALLLQPFDPQLRDAVETMDDYDEYCHYVAGLVGTGLFKLFKASGKQNLGPENLSHEMGIFLQDLQYEENSVKAVQCLNEMVTDALRHVEDCLKHMSVLKDNAVLRFCAIRPVLAMGTLALCYNNIDVFKSGVKLRSGLAAKIYDRTRTITDVYNAFFEFASVMKFKELLTLSKIWMAAATKCVPCSMGLSV